MAKYLDRKGLQKVSEVLRQYINEQDNSYLNLGLDDMYNNIVLHNIGDNITPDGSQKYTYNVLDISSRPGKKTPGVRETISFADYSTTFEGHYTPIVGNGITVLRSNAAAGAITSKESVANYIKSITFDKKGHVLSITSEAVPIKYYNGLDNLSNFEENSYAGFDFISSTGAYNLYNYIKNNYISISDEQHISGSKIFDNQISIIGGTQVSYAGNTGYLIIGNPAISSIGIDNNDIQARTKNVASDIYLQRYGGNTYIGTNNTYTIINNSFVVHNDTILHDNFNVDGTTVLNNTNINGITYFNTNNVYVKSDLIENKNIVLTGETTSNIVWKSKENDATQQRIHVSGEGDFYLQKSINSGNTWVDSYNDSLLEITKNGELITASIYTDNVVTDDITAYSSITTSGDIVGKNVSVSNNVTTKTLTVSETSIINGIATFNNTINGKTINGEAIVISNGLTSSYINIDYKFDGAHTAGHVPYSGSTTADINNVSLQNFLVSSKSGFYSGNTYNVISLRANNGSTTEGMYLKSLRTGNSLIFGNNTGNAWTETNVLTASNSTINRDVDKVNITINGNTETVDLSSYVNSITDVNIGYSPVSTFVTGISKSGHNIEINHITTDALRRALNLTQPLMFQGTLRSATITGESSPVIDYSATTPISDDEYGKLNNKSATIVLNEMDGSNYRTITPANAKNGDIIIDVIKGTEYMWTGTVWTHLGQDTTFLHTTGGSMTGNITMGTYSIKGINGNVILQNTNADNVEIGTNSSVTTIHGKNNLLHDTAIIYDSANTNKSSVDWTANTIHTNKIINDLTSYTLSIGVKAHDNSIYISADGNIGIGTNSLATNNLLSIAGNEYVNGNITSQNIVPTENNAKYIGSPTLLWNNIYSTSFTGSLKGNADSATKLQTTRKLWGNDFNGLNDVSGSMTINGSISFNPTEATDFSPSIFSEVVNARTSLVFKIGDDGDDGFIFRTRIVGNTNDTNIVNIDSSGISVNGQAHISSAIYADAGVGTSNFASHTTGWNVSTNGAADFRSVYADTIYRNNFAVWDAGTLYRIKTTVDADNDTTNGVTDTSDSESIIGAFLKAGFTLTNIGLSSQI